MALTAVLFASLAHAQSPITPGNLLVVRIGSGAAALSNAAQPVYLDEFSPAGSLVQTIALPVAASGPNRAFTNSGTASSEGHLNISPDGAFFTLAGYDAIPGTATIASTTSASVARVIARIDNSGYVDTTTSINNAFSATNVRSVATDNGAQFWVAGNSGGVQWVTIAGSTSTTVSTGAPTNLRTISIYNGNLYCGTASGAYQGISQIGLGLPTAPTNITLLPGFPTSTGPSAYDFFFADANTLYVADDRLTAGAGGIQKWTLAGGTWTMAYSLLPTGTTSVRSLTGSVSNGVVTLFATTTQANTNTLVSIVDAGAASTFSILATAATNTVFRGLRLAGPRGYVSFSGSGSPTSVGIPTIGVNGPPALGNASFAITAGLMPAFSPGFVTLALGPVQSFGIPVPGAPATLNLYLNPLTTSLILGDATGSASLPLPLPAAASFLGTVLAAQNLVIDFLLTAPLPLGASNGMQVSIGR